MKYELINPINNNYSVTQQILTNRGIPLEAIDHYLNVTQADNLNPLLLDNLAEAAVMLIKHLDKENNTIMVQIDSDCDGYTASALLLNYIYSRFPSFIGKFIYRLHDKKIHGIDMDNIPENCSLIIAPDSSSNEYDKHRELAERNIDVLVLDHHESDEVSKYACIVNNQLCDYPTKSLSGVGIVYKLCQYLDTLFADNRADSFLDIVATGLVGDMVDIRDIETHYLIQQGLARFRNPFISGMAKKNAYSLGDVISPIGVAFYIVPLINAVTRVGTMQEKTLLFESMLEWKAYEVIPSTKRGCSGQKETRLEQSLRTCTNVKNRQTKDQDNATEQIEEIIYEQNLLEHKVLVILLDNLTFDRGIVGLVANRLMAKYQRPVCLLVKGEQDGEIVWSGSLRACGIENFRAFCEETGLVVYAQGHPSAAGLAILDKNVSAFVETCDKTFANMDFTPSYKVDFIYNTRTINPRDILEISDLGSLWGQNIDEALVVIENITVTKEMLQLMSRDKNPTLKINLSNGISCIKFRSSEKEYEDLFSESGCVVITILGKCKKNVWNGMTTPQIIIEDYEIITRQEYYF